MKPALSLGEKETQQHKRELRVAMRRTRRLMSRDHRREASSRACAHVLSLPEMATARVVAGYIAVRGEADPAEVLAQVRARGGTVAYPRVVADQRQLWFHAAEPEQLTPGPFGIAAPSERHPRLPLAAIDIVLVPGLAFDRRGSRLGWGQGHYDATLADCPGLRVGFGFHAQKIEHIPTSEHDVPLDLVITEAGIERFGARSLTGAP